MTYPSDQEIADFLESSWKPIDLTAAVSGRQLETTSLFRSDGLGLLYRGRVHWFQGEPESGKSMLGHHETAEVIKVGGRVLMIDFDSDEREVVPRLIAMGCASEDVIDRLDYVRPTEPILDRQDRLTNGALNMERLLAGNREGYELVMIDGVTNALAIEGIDISDNGSVSKWISALPRRFARETDAPVVVVDHVTKSRDGRSRWAIGAQAKLACVDGAAFTIRRDAKFARVLGTEPRRGRIRMVLQKDRPGFIQGHLTHKSGAVADVEVTAWPDGTLGLEFKPPAADDAAALNLRLQTRIIDYLRSYDGATQNAITSNVTGKAHAIRQQITVLREGGFIVVDKTGGSHRHHLTESGQAWPA